MDRELGCGRRARRRRGGTALRPGRRGSGTGGRGRGFDLLAGHFADGEVVVVGPGQDVLRLGLVVEVGVVVVNVVVEPRLAVEDPFVVIGHERIGRQDRVVPGFGGRLGGFERIVVGRLGLGLGLGRARGSVGHPFVVTPGALHNRSEAAARAPVYRSGSQSVRRGIDELRRPRQTRVFILDRCAGRTVRCSRVATQGIAMSDRTLERILADWRTAEYRLDDDPSNADLQALVDQLRSEYATVVKARDRDGRDMPRRSELLRQG